MSFIQMERRQLAERADGKLARALGRTLPDESQEEIDRGWANRANAGRSKDS